VSLEIAPRSAAGGFQGYGSRSAAVSRWKPTGNDMKFDLFAF